MFYSNYFYNFVGFLFGLMVLAIPLTAQYSQDSIPALLFGVFYLVIIILRSVSDISVAPISRLIVHVVYMALAIRTAYISCIHIIALNNVISYIDFILASIACIIFLLKALKIFTDNFEYILHYFY